MRMVDRTADHRPGSVIPTAEQYGLIEEIDSWVIDKAVKLAASG